MKHLKPIISIILVLFFLLSSGSLSLANNADTPVTRTVNAAIEDFVERMILEVLGRSYDKEEIDYWLDLLGNETTGAGIAHSIIFSNEYIRRNIPNSLFIDMLYNALWDRPSDYEGRRHWAFRLNTGWTREDVLSEFINSEEFNKLCNQIGITSGTFTPPPRRMSRLFVIRLYWTTQIRHPDIKDLDFWHSSLEMGVPAEVVAYNFIFSPEMQSRNLSDTQFINILYQALLDRNIKTEELTLLRNRLQSGESRFNVYTGVINSSEFTRLVSNFKIARGITPFLADAITDSTIVDRLWHHIARAGFTGISDRPEHIAGIIGNMMSEAGLSLCPFQIQVSNQRGLGLMQWTNASGSSGGRRTEMENFMWNSGIPQDAFMDEMNKHLTRYCNHPTGLHPPDLLDRVLDVQVQFMFHELRNTWERHYMDYTNYPAGKTDVEGARAYAELFCALALRPGDGGIYNTVEDYSVLEALRSSPWSHRTSYSALALRRDRAEAVYLAYLRSKPT